MQGRKTYHIMLIVLPIIFTLFLFNVALCVEDLPRQPYLGFDGKLVKLPKDSVPEEIRNDIRGMEVHTVRRGTPAAKMGLERGDIIVTIDTWAFRSNAGYLAALRQAQSQKPSIVIIDSRTGKMVRRSCNLPHKVDEHKHPDTVQIAIDLLEDFRDRGP